MNIYQTEIIEEFAAPYICLNNGQFYIILNNSVFISCISFVNSFLTLICIYFSFNIMYPEDMKLSLIFIQKILINHQDKQKKQYNIIKLINSIM